MDKEAIVRILAPSIGCPNTLYPDAVPLSQENPNRVQEQPPEIDRSCENLGFPCAKLVGKTTTLIM
jgi:hypothetical protein